MFRVTSVSAVCMEKGPGRILELSRESLPVRSLSTLWTQKACRVHSVSTCSSTWIVHLGLVSSWEPTRSTNPLSNRKACTCMCSTQRTCRGDRPEKALNHWTRHRALKRMRASRVALCTRQGHIPSDEASVHAPLVNAWNSRRPYGSMGKSDAN